MQVADRQLGTFLAKFDAIFTLNQDVLLEHHFLSHGLPLSSSRISGGPSLPGMKPIAGSDGTIPISWAQRTWIPRETLTLQPNTQPCFKLHGSSNWRDAAGSKMLIIGNRKIRDIRLHPILNWYAENFDRYLGLPNTRLMVIGYGFRDQHINESIEHAVEQGLKTFIIDPAGSDIGRNLNLSKRPENIGQDSKLENALHFALIGASRRELSRIFGGDSVEHHKVQRFFAP
jgi:hypothetical protein